MLVALFSSIILLYNEKKSRGKIMLGSGNGIENVRLSRSKFCFRENQI